MPPPKRTSQVRKVGYTKEGTYPMKEMVKRGTQSHQEELSY